MSAAKGKVGVFEETVKHYDHFAHDGIEGDLGRFTLGEEPLIEPGEDGVVLGGADSGHIQDIAHRDTPAVRMSGAHRLAAVVGVRCDTDQTGDLFVLEHSELFTRKAGEEIVGCATGSALDTNHEALIAPLRAAGVDLASTFYNGESVLSAAYRGRGLGHAFFDQREAHARARFYKRACFCAVTLSAAPPKRRSLR